MRVALIADMHFGVRKDSPIFAGALERFLENVFWPTLKKQKIRHIICLGDVFDSRPGVKTISTNAFEKFLDKVHAESMTLDIIIGNHDTAYNNTNMVNSVRPIVTGWDCVRLFEGPQVVSLDNKWGSLYLPWVCEENVNETMRLLKDSTWWETPPYVFGHLEVVGTPTGTGMTYEHGFKRGLFKPFKRVLAGHIHLRSSIGNIDYIGAPTEHNWGDYQTEKGFGILDLATNELTYFDNPETVHLAIDINWKGNDKLLENKIVKVVIPEDIKPAKRAKMLAELNEKGMAELSVVESYEIEAETSQEILEVPSSQIDMMAQYIEKYVTGPVDKDKLKTLLNTTYEKVIKETTK